MTTDRLAALLHSSICNNAKHRNAGMMNLCEIAAARLAAAGVTAAPKPDSPAADDGVACDWDENGYCRCRPAPALDVERLREAAQAAAFALDFHNKTPTGRRRSCDPKCIACAAIDALRAALATGDEP